jgi:DNA-binding PadR family transcriptional regulator
MKNDQSLTPLRLAILGLVGMYPQSGYDLKKVFETTPMGHFSSSPGAIYPALKGLEKKGWVRGEPDKMDSLRPRVVYSLTGEGEAILRAELEKPVTHEDLIWHFDQVMLRFAFIERLGSEHALRFLTEFRDQSDAYVRHLEGLRDEMREQLTPCGRLALEHGIRNHVSGAEWARHALDELSKLETK